MERGALHVFLSHTSELRKYPEGRSFVDAAEQAVIRAQGTVTDMEYFTSREGKPADYCREKVQPANVYVGIIGFRYGSPVLDQPELSYTELEFKAATDKGAERLIFLLDADTNTPLPLPRKYQFDPKYEDRQQAFRAKLMDPDTGLTWQQVQSPERLETLLFQRLEELQRPVDQVLEQSADPAPDIALFPLAGSVQRQLQEALDTLRRAADAIGQVEHGAAPEGIGNLDIDVQEAMDKQLAASVTVPAADVEIRSQQALQSIRDAGDGIRRISARRFAGQASRLSPVIRALTDVEQATSDLLSKVVQACDDLHDRAIACSDYQFPQQALERAYLHVEEANSSAIQMKQRLSRLPATPPPRRMPAVQAKPQQPEPKPDAVVSSLDWTTAAEAVSIPIARDVVAAGTPDTVSEPTMGDDPDVTFGERGEQVPLPLRYARKGVFAVRATGDSMTEDGILPGDYVIVDGSRQPTDGDVVVVHLEGRGEIVKRQRLKDGKPSHLESANGEEFPVDRADTSVLKGTVIGTFHLFR